MLAFFTQDDIYEIKIIYTDGDAKLNNLLTNLTQNVL